MKLVTVPKKLFPNPKSNFPLPQFGNAPYTHSSSKGKELQGQLNILTAGFQNLPVVGFAKSVGNRIGRRPSAPSPEFGQEPESG